MRFMRSRPSLCPRASVAAVAATFVALLMTFTPALAQDGKDVAVLRATDINAFASRRALVVARNICDTPNRAISCPTRTVNYRP